MITPLGDHVPPDIRRAVEGSLRGWQRLHRFQAAMDFPTISAAAAHLSAHPASLIHQFCRLEKDIGHTLYQRASGGKPMQPTERGAALIAALNSPHVAAIAAARSSAATQSLRQPGPAVASHPRSAGRGGLAAGTIWPWLRHPVPEHIRNNRDQRGPAPAHATSGDRLPAGPHVSHQQHR